MIKNKELEAKQRLEEEAYLANSINEEIQWALQQKKESQRVKNEEPFKKNTEIISKQEATKVNEQTSIDSLLKKAEEKIERRKSQQKPVEKMNGVSNGKDNSASNHSSNVIDDDLAERLNEEMMWAEEIKKQAQREKEEIEKRKLDEEKAKQEKERLKRLSEEQDMIKKLERGITV